jgi:hypothetical protein
LGKINDVDDVLAHPWFKELDQNELLAKKIPAPFVPKVVSPGDTSNFDEKYQ